MTIADDDLQPTGSIRRQSTSDLVKRRILGWIEDGRYQPGEALPSEREMQAEFNVSRVSVREALVGLEAVGLVQIHQGKGCFVSSRMSDAVRRPFAVWLNINRDEIVALLKVRSVLDGLAAHEAVLADDTVLLKEVRVAHDAFRDAAIEGADPSRLAKLDKAFHLSIATASGLGVVQDLLRDLDGHVANSHRITMAIEGRARQSAKEHGRILAAIEAGNADRARKEAKAHVTGIIAIIEAYVDGDTTTDAGT